MNRCLRINRMAIGEARTHGRAFTALNIMLIVGCILQSYIGGTADVMDSNISNVAIILFCLGGLTGPIFVSGVFREMHSRQHSDVVFALPASAGERYVSKLLALWYLHVLPVVVWTGIATLITLQRENSTGRSSYVFSVYPADRIVRCFMFLIVGVMFLNAVAVVCAVCCGRLVEMHYLTFLTAVSLSMAPLLLRSQLMERIGGQTTDPGWWYYIWTLSPIAWDSSVPTKTFVTVCLINCLVSVAVVALAFLIYRGRDAGSAGKPIVSRVFFEIALVIGLVAYYSLLLFETSLGAIIALAGVVYLVIHIISFRGILSGGKLALWLGKFIVTTAAFVLLLWVAFATDGFGAIRYVPSQDMNGACIKVQRDWSYYELDPRDRVAYAGVSSYRYEQNSEGDIVAVEDIPSKYISDTMMRRVVEVFQKNAADRDKDFLSFLEFFVNNRETKDGDTRDLSCTVEIWFPNEEGQVMQQSVQMTAHQAYEMMQELKALGCLNFDTSWPVDYWN